MEPAPPTLLVLVEPMIRDAYSSDAEALVALIRHLGYPASADAVRERVERLWSSEADRLVVAELDGEIVGLASLHTSLSIAYDGQAAKLSAIVVDERHRQRGIGRALVEEMEREAKRRGCCLVFLTTAGRREDAHAFYERMGFEETGRRFTKRLR
jgi:N-acetylglutamate synthase-like GNAT family acetyltransferase